MGILRADVSVPGLQLDTVQHPGLALMLPRFYVYEDLLSSGQNPARGPAFYLGKILSWVQSAPGAVPGAAAGVPGRCRAPEAHSLGFSLLTPSPLTEFWVWSSYQGFSRHQPQAESLLEGICTAKHLKSSSLQAPSQGKAPALEV